MCVHHERLGEGVWILRHSMKSDKGPSLRSARRRSPSAMATRKLLPHLIRSGDFGGHPAPTNPSFNPRRGWQG